ncbi:MAG TPA: hypothetical protein ENI90_01360 [Methylothermaceae bacterium]|nr:hypothetical protein [Methylothermaceae bacterium]
MAVLLLSGAGGYAAWRVWQSAKTDLVRQEQTVRGLKSELAQRRQDLAVMAELGPRFRRLRRRAGWEVDRIDWIEVNDALASELSLPALVYAVAPRQIVAEEDGLVLWRSGIELQLGLVHGEQMLDWWRALEAAGLGYFSLEQCRIERGGKVPVPGRANLKGKCQLDWYGWRPVEDDDDAAAGTAAALE